MSFLNKTISFLAIFSVLPVANAATSARPSVASPRMPTMSVGIRGNVSGTTTTTTSSSSSLLGDMECIDAYTGCIKGADACGSDFEECTTRVLFHAKMPQCLSTLAQCTSNGINSLFGVGNTASLNVVATKNSYGEVTDYTYPTDGSILGQLITGAAIANKYDTSTCVKRYTSCLKKDSVCGGEFELCTTDKEFRKQRVFCDSTLARCQSEGIIELFGSYSTTTTPSATSRIGELINEGASLAAVNAVSTCYKVIDQCIIGACTANPYRCNENSVKSVADLVDSINNGTASAETKVEVSDMISKSEISGYIKNACLSTIGSNKYCYATFLGNGQMPTASQLKDEDNQEEIFDEAYSARMNSAMRSKITELMDSFDTKAKQKCTETIRSCAMRTCGGGSGAACYSQVFGAADKSINNKVSRAEIKIGCEAIVNTDANCKYAAANPNSSGEYSYSYINSSAFDTLFPEYDGDKNSDPIGVVASLNAALATNYSDAALAQMKKQCQSLATSCVRSMCGTDFENCYRARTDAYSNITNTGNAAYDKSMNKVGGVLDYTTALGLCVNTVKNSSVCEEHLAIEQNKLKIAHQSEGGSWGNSSTVREGWLDAGSATKITAQTESIQAVDENGQNLCSSTSGDQGPCNTVDASGNVFDTPVMISYTNYYQDQAASSLFKDLIFDLEKEAQAKYNAKLTQEQHLCLAQNNGGIIGNSDTGSSYMWVKLKSNKVPKNYSVAGLNPNQFVASNDLYGSFCRVRVTLQSDDKRIQDVLREGADWSTAYFAVGDPITCGSWIPSSALEKLANAVADDAVADQKANADRTRKWLTALGGVGGAVGGGFLGNGIASGSILGGVTGIKKDKNEDTSSNFEKCYKSLSKMTSSSTMTVSSAVSAANSAIVSANAGIKELVKNNGYDADTDFGDLDSAIEKMRSALNGSYTGEYKDEKGTVTETRDAQIENHRKTLIANIGTVCKQTTGREGAAYKKLCSGDNVQETMFLSAGTIVDAKKIVAGDVTKECVKGTPGPKCNMARQFEHYIDTYTSAVAAAQDKIGPGTKKEVKSADKQKLDAIIAAAPELAGACMKLDREQYTKDEKKKNKKLIGTAVGSAVTGATGALVLNRISKSIQDKKLDEAHRQAYDEWMQAVGNHITCHVGNETAEYGSIFSATVE